MSIAKQIIGALIAAAVATFAATGVHAQSAMPESRGSMQLSLHAEPDAVAQRPSHAPRILVELLTGGTANVLATYAAFNADLGGWSLPFVSAATSGMVQLTGNLMGSHGQLGWTLLGGAIGTAIAAPISFALMVSSICIDNEDTCDVSLEASAAMQVGAIASWVLIPTLGAIIAHENSSDDVEDDMDAVRIAPSIAPTADMRGATASVVGTF